MDTKEMTYQLAHDRLEKLTRDLQRGDLHYPQLKQIAEEVKDIALYLKTYFENQRTALQQAAFNISFPTQLLTQSPLPQSARQAGAIPPRTNVAASGEKRRHSRVGLIVSVEMSMEGYNISGRITDLSAGGFFVDTLTIFGAGTELEFSFSTEEARIEGRGVVRTSIEQFGMGIEITDISNASATALGEYLRQLE